MARTHAHTHGKSHSIRPSTKDVPNWINQKPKEIVELIVKLSNEGLSPSEIGLKLRDEYAIPLVKPILGKSITTVLNDNKINFTMPEDLNKLVQKALGLQKHLKTHNSDHRNVRSLELIESKIHRISKYYKNNGKIPSNWKYSAVIAQLE
ncbi:MAG TPA: 30S ribosomal protein S15 [Nitrososphaeraceae archaeon]|jgi:small subunit ribosomal protein S15|nr:30S ribosomal protein S15 [Nitrososphaeraceae archaeon]